MINLTAIRYVRLGTADLDAAVTYATDVVGLELVRREDGRAYLRGDDRDHNLCYVQGDPADNTVGFELATMAELDDAARQLEGQGISVTRGDETAAAERRVIAFLNFTGPSGIKVDLVVRPFHSGKRYFPSRDAGITEFSHVGIHSNDPPRDEMFWTSLFNVHANDWIGPAPLMSFDHIHHRMALFPSQRSGVQHINFQVESIDDIMRSHYFLTDRQVRIVFGPGRHPTSTAMFLYFEGPDGMVYEYSSGVRLVDDDWRPRQFGLEPISFCMWGSKPDIPEFREMADKG